jgi:hypothetical protein
VYILRRGPLEAYLPDGYKSKDINKLIELLGLSDYWNRLPQMGRAELELIAGCILSE